MKSLSGSMKKLLSCSIVGFLTLAAGEFCHAQNPEMHVSVVWYGFGAYGGGMIPAGVFDI